MIQALSSGAAAASVAFGGSEFTPTAVTLPNGNVTQFTPNPSGGGVWNGKYGQNDPTEFGYTYGYVMVNGVEVQGYTCHGSGGFRAANEAQFDLIGQEPELTLEQRKASSGF